MAEAADPAGLCSLAQAFRSVMRMIATVPMWPMARQRGTPGRLHVLPMGKIAREWSRRVHSSVDWHVCNRGGTWARAEGSTALQPVHYEKPTDS